MVKTIIAYYVVTWDNSTELILCRNSTKGYVHGFPGIDTQGNMATIKIWREKDTWSKKS